MVSSLRRPLFEGSEILLELVLGDAKNVSCDLHYGLE